MFVMFQSHRQRQNGLEAIGRKPQGYWSLKRKTHKGVYDVTPEEAEIMRAYADFTVLRGPYDDLLQCW